MHIQKTKPTRHRAHPVKTVAFAIAGAIVLQGLMLSPLQAHQPKQEKFADKDVTSAVEERFLFDKAVPWTFVDVKTNEGIVTLTGTVDNLLAKERATKIAESTKGVRAVVNNLTVQIAPRTDDEVRRDVENALLNDAATDSYGIKTAVKDGLVTLTGKVESAQGKDLSEHLAKGIRGVKAVKNDIVVAYKAARPDPEIIADAKRALAVDVWVDSSHIQVNAANGKVTLSGSVGSAAEKSRAQALTWVAGVKDVDAQALKVDPSLARTTRAPGITILPDDEISKAVEAAFVYDPRVYSFNPTVEASHGVVTLSGVVDNVKAKQAAEQDARNTVGVYRVKNHLKVRPVNAPPNDKLTQNVKDALQRDVIVDASDIHPVANNGTVTLNGAVDSNYQKSHAEDIVERLNGVAQVNNRLEVKNPALTFQNMWWEPYYAYNPYYRSWPPLAVHSDAEIKDDIENELFWSPFVDAREVKVSVEHGVATLTGKVDNWSEFRSAAENAREGGATSVINNLIVGQG